MSEMYCMEEIKDWFCGTETRVGFDDITRIKWLISELEKCRAENAEYNALFILQRTRLDKAAKMWRQATNNPDTVFPDLGVLLEWLMWELETNKALLDRYQKVEKGWRDETEGIETEIKRLKAILANAGIAS